MLVDYIIGLLPATEDFVFRSYPKVSRDFLGRRMRDLELRGQIRNCRGIYYEIRGTIGPDGWHPEGEIEADGPQEVGRKGKPESQKTKKCRKCGTQYTGLLKNFNTIKSSVCKSCVKGSKKQAMTRTCKTCGKTFEGLKNHFSQKRIVVDGRERRVWKDVCKTCEKGG